MNARMAHRVFAQPLDVIDCLCGVGVAYKFSIEIKRVIRRFERPAKVVHGKDVLEELRLLKLTNPPRLARWIKLVSHGVGSRVEVVIVARLVYTHAPKNNRGMVPVATNHAADVIDRDVLPRMIADVLPARNLFEHKQANLVAGVEKVVRLRVV